MALDLFDLGDVSLDDPEALLRRMDANADAWLKEYDARLLQQRKRALPRLDPVKSAIKAIAKNPNIVARVLPGGVVEIAAKACPEIRSSFNAGADDRNEWDTVQ